MEDIILGNEYLVQDYGTSDGTQDKYYKDGKWYKLDRFGGEDIIKKISNMEFDDQAEFIISFVEKEAHINIEQMLGRLFYLDKIILNEDRHFNNIGLIFDGDRFRTAPIFDNGKSFFCGNKKYSNEKSIDENIKAVRFRPFTTSIDMMINRFSNDITFDFNKINMFLEQISAGIHKEVLTKRLVGQ